MKFSWDLIHTFDAVAKTGSLLAAAKQLGLSQPTIGRHIDILEQALNVTLFVRSRAGMALTEAGADLVATSDEMMRNATDFHRKASGLEKGISGTLRLSVNDILGVYVLPGLLRDFMNRHPDIQVELDISNKAANLLARDADVALRMFRPTQNDLIARKVVEIPVGFYAHRSYLELHGQPVGIADLLAHRFVGFDRETFHIDAAKSLGLTLTPADFSFRCDNIPAQIEAIRVGMGIGILHQGLAANMAGVERLLANIALPPLELWLAWHSDLQHNARIRLLVDFLADRLRMPYGNTNDAKS